MIVSCEYLFEIGVPCKIGIIISECKYCPRSISSYPREFHKELYISRKNTSIFFADDPRSTQYISRSGIVAHSLIMRKKFLIACSCKTMDCRVHFENSLKIGNDSIYLSLLEENFWEPYAIESLRIFESIVSPAEIMTTVLLVPVDKILPWKCRKRGMHNPNIVKTEFFARRWPGNCTNFVYRTLYFVLQREIETL